MKKIMLCLFAFVIMLMSACEPAPTVLTEPVPIVISKSMTFKLSDDSLKGLDAVNENGQHLVRLGFKAGTIPSDSVLPVGQAVYKQGQYTSDAVREILSLMFPDIAQDQYVSDELFAEFSNGTMRGSASFGEVVYLSESQYYRVCNSTLFGKDSIIRYSDFLEDEQYKSCGYYDLYPESYHDIVTNQ